MLIHRSWGVSAAVVFPHRCFWRKDAGPFQRSIAHFSIEKHAGSGDLQKMKGTKKKKTSNKKSCEFCRSSPLLLSKQRQMSTISVYPTKSTASDQFGAL